jgi:hypothetical protein
MNFVGSNLTSTVMCAYNIPVMMASVLDFLDQVAHRYIKHQQSLVMLLELNDVLLRESNVCNE